MTNAINRTLFVLGVALFYLRLHRLVIWLGRNNPKVLLYHDCSDSETPYTANLDSTLSPEIFGRHLDYIMRHYQVVDFSSFEREDVPRYAVAITFDDGYRSVYENAFPQLRKRGLPAMIYIITDVVGNERLVWVNELNHHLRTHSEIARPLAAAALGVPPETTPQDMIIAARRNFDPVTIDGLLAAIRKAAAIRIDELSRQAMLYVDWQQLAEMQESEISIGNHTKTHPNLAALEPDRQRIEMAEAQQVLDARVGPVTSIAYPFGHHNQDTLRVAREAGLTSMAEVGGANRPLDRSHIARVHVLATSEAGLFAQMEVVEPVKALLRTLLSPLGMKFGTK